VHGRKIFTYNHSFTGARSIDLPDFKGVCLVKPLSSNLFSAQKLILE